jgi:hypothetical protein
MQKKCLEILRQHGELWSTKDQKKYLSDKFLKPTINSFFPKPNPNFKGNNFSPSGFSVNINALEYQIDQKLYKILEKVYHRYLDEILDDGKEFLIETIAEKLKFYSTSKIDKVKLINDLLVEQYRDLESLIGDINRMNSTEGKKENWIFYLLEHGEDLIQCLKIDVFKYDEIQNFESDWQRYWFNENFHSLDKFFLTDKMTSHYKVIVIDENIKHLKRLINDLENKPIKPIGKKKIYPHKTKYSHKAIAIACIILGENITKENASAILKKYSDSKSVKSLLNKKINSTKQLSILHKSEISNGKHLKALEAAKRIIEEEERDIPLYKIKTIIKEWKEKREMHHV